MEKKYVIEEKILNNVLQYLQGQPFGAVATLIQSIQTAVPYVEPKESKPSKDEKKSK